jgi:phosphoribosyl 1,2-cyclic phosphate phosphodiesterase
MRSLKHRITLPAVEAELADLPDYVGPDSPRLRFLGTGTSAGVPYLGCKCKVCTSNDPRDKRLRSAALLETKEARILIDAGPDIRQQLMPLDFYPLDAVLLTHIHYDHVGGIDDLRGFCIFGDQHIYADKNTADGLRRQLPYCFTDRLYPGVPLLKLHEIRANKPFRIKDTEIMPIQIIHGKVPILGYRIGKMAYITDMKTINDDQLPYLEGIETLVVNALRWTIPHHSHMLVDEAIAFSRKIKAKQTYLIHLTHRIGLHDEAEAMLPSDIHLAYDGLVIDV